MKQQHISKAIGIDLGTTNSTVAVLDPAEQSVLVYTDPITRKTAFPSIVYKDPVTGKINTGDSAANRIGSTPEPIRSIKRKMGDKSHVLLTDAYVSPEEISSYILGDMKQKADILFSDISREGQIWVADRAVITIPAYFDQHQIEATCRAGEIANLRVLELLHEPNAAAIHYCWRHNITNGTFLIYDFGGGTFDVSVIRCTCGLFEVVGISGNVLLGGDDLDLLIAEYLRIKVLEFAGGSYDLDLNLTVPRDHLIRTRFTVLAEQVKIGLSSRTIFHLDDASITDKNGKSVIISMDINREEIEELMLPLIERTIKYCFDALDIAGQNRNIHLIDIDTILLVGGTTHIPLVREVVRKNLCNDVAHPYSLYPVRICDPRADQPRASAAEPVYDPDFVQTTVALGAAIYASARGGLILTDSRFPAIHLDLKGMSSTAESSIPIAGVVSSDDSVSLEGYKLKLAVKEVQYTDTEPIQENSVFLFPNVPLHEGGTTLLFTLNDADQNLAGEYERVIYRTRDSSVIDPTHPPVLSKSILIEVSLSGSAVKKMIFPSLTPLPIEEQHIFYHPGNVDQIRIPVYQQNTQIHEIRVAVPPNISRGTRIFLTLRISERYLISVVGTIESTGVTFSADIVPPPDSGLPSLEDLELLCRKFEEKIQILNRYPGKKTKILIYETHFHQLYQSVRQAMEALDSSRAIHDFEELEKMVESVEITILIPPLEEFTALTARLERFNDRLSVLTKEKKIPHNQKLYAQLIKNNRSLGERAYKHENQEQYTKANMALSQIETTLQNIQAACSGMRFLTDREVAEGLFCRVSESIEKLMVISQNLGKTEYIERLNEYRSTLARLSSDLEDNPESVKSRLIRIDQNLKQMAHTLSYLSSDVFGLVEDSVVCYSDFPDRGE